jgi:uncharacterized membrane protein
MLGPLTVSAEMRSATHSRERAWNARAYNALLVGSIAFGSALRIAQYASNRALWRDESGVALNILGRSFGGLLRPLAFHQAAPPGFLLVEKLATTLFGSSEYALRLFPLLCGLAALPLFALLSRRLLAPWPAAFATLLFACAGALAYYSAEVKQYSTDVAATLVLLLLGVHLWEQRVVRPRTVALFAAGGCISLFFSFAAVFPTVAIVVVLACRELVRRPRRVTPVLAVIGAWGVASLLVVVFSHHVTAGVLSDFKSSTSAYVGTSSSTLLPSLRQPASSLAEDISGLPPLSSPLYWFTVAVALVGLAGVARRRPAYAGFFVGAGVLMLIASSLHRYPIADRTVLFLVPIAILLLAEGMSVIATAVRRPSARAALAAALAAVVVAVPGWRALHGIVHPQKHEEIKAALATISRDWRPTDTLYVSNPTQFALRYYLECSCIDTPRWPFRRTDVSTSKQRVALLTRAPNLIAGQAPLAGLSTYVTDVRKLDGRARVWLLYSHVTTGTELAYVRDVLPREISRFGRLRRVFTATGVTLYLYDLRAR